MRITARFQILSWIAIAILIAWSAVASNYFMNFEAVGWMRHSISDRPFWEKIFDVRGTEYGIFRARELGYLPDAIDAQLLFQWLLRGHLVFVSVSYFVLLVLLTAGTFRFLCSTKRLEPWILLLLMSIFLVSPTIHDLRFV